jgi:hypothetical protein
MSQKGHFSKVGMSQKGHCGKVGMSQKGHVPKCTCLKKGTLAKWTSLKMVVSQSANLAKEMFPKLSLWQIVCVLKGSHHKIC